MKFTPEQIKAARRVINGFEDERRRLLRDRRAHAEYWNGDSWGSMSGIRDAEDWLFNNLANYLLRRMRKVL
jgi:hypothetical protein